MRLLETLPKRLTLVLRHVGRLPPALHQVGERPGDLLGPHLRCAFEGRGQSLHVLTKLFLHSEVGPPLPVGEVPQLAHPADQRTGGFLQPPRRLLVIAPRRKWRRLLEGLTRNSQLPLGFGEAQLVVRKRGLDTLDQLADPGQVLLSLLFPPGPDIGLKRMTPLVYRRLARLQRGQGLRRPCVRARILFRQRGPLTPPRQFHRPPATAPVGRLFARNQLLQLRNQDVQRPQPLVLPQECRVARLARAGRGLEAAREGLDGGLRLRVGVRIDAQRLPLHAGLPQALRRGASLQALYPLAEGNPRRLRRGSFRRGSFRRDHRGVQRQQPILHGPPGRPEPLGHRGIDRILDRGPALHGFVERPAALLERGHCRRLRLQSAAQVAARQCCNLYHPTLRTGFQCSPRTPRHALVPRLPGHRLQQRLVDLAGIHQPLAGSERRRLVVGLHGHRKQLVPIGHPPDGVQRNLHAPGTPRHGSKHLVARKPLERRPAHRLELCRARDGHQIALVDEHVQRPNSGSGILRLDKGVPDGGHCLDAGVVVRVAGIARVLQKGNQSGQIRHPLDRGAAHAGSRIAPGDLEQQVAVVLGQITHRGDPHRGVFTLPGRLSTQSFEQLHDSDGWTDFGGLCILGTGFVTASRIPENPHSAARH